jgi:hypothetical protein
LDTRRTGRIFGWFFIGTFITSIPARFLFIDGLGASWTETVFNPGDVSDTSLKLGSILEFGVIATNIATAVVLYPIARRQSETVSLGYVTARIMESVFIAIGLISIIAVVDVNDAWAQRVGPRPPRSKHRATRWCPSTTGPSSSGPDSLSASGTA